MRRQKSSALAQALPPLQIVNHAIAELRPDPMNPRKHPRAQIRKLACSIETFGFSVPILVDARHQIIAGHGRVEACKLLGWAEVPTICLSHLTPQQARALLVADNQLSASSAWDDQTLAQVLLELSTADLDFSLEATGFDMGEIDWRIAGLADAPDAADSADDLPRLEAEAVSQPGDLWIVGQHRLLCGNALDQAAYDAVLEGQSARMVFTDPPYNVPIHGNVSGLGAHQHREFAMASGEMTQAQFVAFLEKALGLASGNLLDGGMSFTCIDWRHVADLVACVTRLRAELKNICVWAKHNPGMGSLYRSGHELVVVAKHGAAPHINNIELGRHGRHRSNVWRYPGANSLSSRRGREGDVLAVHPTPKPVALVADAILDCSNRGDLVLDPFLGSGTTLVAAERTGRRCRAIELDPIYVDAAVRRFEKLTGQKASHAGTGASFQDLAVSRTSQREELSHGQ